MGGKEASAIIFVMVCFGGLFMSLIWLIIGWRIMRALERISKGLSEVLPALRHNPSSSPAQVSESGAAAPRQDVLNRLVQDGD